MDMIQQTNKELLLEILTEFKFIRNEIKEIKKILKEKEDNEPRHLPEVEDKINSWFWTG
jgi:hypothetical protein|tara:strand:- start:126 stop:302 length:177 start_codon:yes stop_codon:yes gene_type:complete